MVITRQQLYNKMDKALSKTLSTIWNRRLPLTAKFVKNKEGYYDICQLPPL